MLRTEPSQLKQDTFRDVCALYLNSEAKSETKQWSHSEVIHETTYKTLTDLLQIKGQIYSKMKISLKCNIGFFVNVHESNLRVKA